MVLKGEMSLLGKSTQAVIHPATVPHATLASNWSGLAGVASLKVIPAS